MALLFNQQITTQIIPGGSSIEVLGKHLVLIGDDAKYLGVYNYNFELTTKVQLWDSENVSIEKKKKADLEASFILTKNNVETLQILGSGSKGEKRNWLLEVTEKGEGYHVEKYYNPPIYEILKTSTNEKINIEAAELINNIIWLGNRGNKLAPNNYFVGFNYANFPNNNAAHALKINIPTHKVPFGISGLYLHKKSQIVYATFSSEDTEDAYLDGAIGPSAIATFNLADFNTTNTQITPTSFEVLDNLYSQLRGQKIESICVYNNQLVFVADNDNQESSLFVFDIIP